LAGRGVAFTASGPPPRAGRAPGAFDGVLDDLATGEMLQADAIFARRAHR
jgi:hypothetical protein